jgi:hypothetical protein
LAGLSVGVKNGGRGTELDRSGLPQAPDMPGLSSFFGSRPERLGVIARSL